MNAGTAQKTTTASIDRTGGYLKNDFVVEAYDWLTPHSTRQDAPFFLSVISQGSGHTLELGCGTGRVLIPIARAGYQITGVDLSDKMLSLCQRKLAAESIQTRSNVVELVTCDMADFSLRHRFDYVIIPFFSFNYLVSVDEQLSCLSSIRKHLNSNGKIILDLPNPRACYLEDDLYLKEFGQEPPFETPDGNRGWRKYRISSRDLDQQIVEIETAYYILRPDGSELRLVNRFVMHYLFASDIESLMLRSGFEIDHVYGGHKHEPYEPLTSENILVVAHIRGPGAGVSG